MLTAKTRALVEQLCETLDQAGLKEVMKIARANFDAKMREEMGEWTQYQPVMVKMGRNYVNGRIETVNKRTLTVDVGGRKIRVPPSALRRPHVVRE